MSIGSLEGQCLGGRYEIQTLLGQGGMAAVYKGFDPNLHRTVAIKVIHPHLSNNPEFTRRFEEEATAIAHLRHPNIIQVFDFNHSDGLYYMVMEHILGETLQARLKRLNTSQRKMPVAEVVQFTADLCAAAEYAHQRGMIHRDIKPANVMLDVHGKAILMDFGIARMVGAGQHTASGAVLGTAMYMSPEQIQGLAVDARADIYSLGVTLFEMLSGRPPFEADSAMTLMMMHLNDPLPDLNQIQPDAPPGLRMVVERSLAKNREQRFQTAGEMAKAVQLALSAPASDYAQAAAGWAAGADQTLIEGAQAFQADATYIEGQATPLTPPGGYPPRQTPPGGYPARQTPAGGYPAGAARQTPPGGYPPSGATPAGGYPTGGTLIEQRPAGASPQSGYAQPGGYTPAAGYPPVSPATAFPSTPEASAYPVAGKRGGSKLFIILGLVAVLAVAGFFAYRQFGGALGLGAAVSKATDLPAVVVEGASTALSAPAEGGAATIQAVAQAGATQASELVADPQGGVATIQAAAAADATKAAQVLADSQASAATIQAAAGEATQAAGSVAALPADTATPEPTQAAAGPVIGGADKIAWLSGGNIWVANLDGTELVQLTTDGSAKTDLRWLPGGSGLSYISGKCVQAVTLGGEVSTIACYNYAKFVDAFEISPDWTQVAVSMDNQLYLVPFDLDGLAKAGTHDSLAALADCPDLAPYQRNFAKEVNWSKDGKQWAALVLGVLKDGRRGDLIQVFAVDRCIPNPMVQIQFPEPHFQYKSYTSNPVIPSIRWDGVALFVFNDSKRNGGFGDLHFFNMQDYRAQISANPIRGRCCYRDASWSPDGSQLVVAFQDIGEGSASVTRLYMIPYGSIGTGTMYEPLPLPEISDAKESPQPVLRPAE